jgi:hypothetical protein
VPAAPLGAFRSLSYLLSLLVFCSFGDSFPRLVSLLPPFLAVLTPFLLHHSEATSGAASVFTYVTSGADGALSTVTSGAAGAFSTATSGAASVGTGIASTVTSGAGGVASTITSAGGVATSGAGGVLSSATGGVASACVSSTLFSTPLFSPFPLCSSTDPPLPSRSATGGTSAASSNAGLNPLSFLAATALTVGALAGGAFALN